MSHWEEFLPYGQKKTARKNTVLFRQGDAATGFYYLHEGEVVIQVLSDQGHERVIDYVGAKELIGEQAINGQSYFTTAKVISPSILYYFPKKTFQEVCSNHPHALNTFMRSLIAKERLLAHTVSLLDTNPEFQMAFFLHRVLQKRDHNPEIKINQSTIARYIGTSRVTVYKILLGWRQKGIIDIVNRSIYIVDPEKLQQLVNRVQK